MKSCTSATSCVAVGRYYRIGRGLDLLDVVLPVVFEQLRRGHL
jgi:hypothetical protein